MTSWLEQPHHDGSELYVERFGDSAELRLRVPEGGADAVVLRYVRDGEARTVEASVTARTNGEVWWRAEIPVRNPVVSYRWLLTGGKLGYRWLNGMSTYAHEVPPGGDFRLTAEPGGPEWHLSSVVYEVFIDRFAASGTPRPLPEWAVGRAWDRIPDSVTRNPHRELFGGDLLGIEQHLDHIESLGANAIYLTPIFPAESNHRYDPESFDRVDPVIGGEEAFDSLARAARDRDIRLIGDFSIDHSGYKHEWFEAALADPSSPERAFFLFDRTETHGYQTWFGYKEMPRLDWRSDELRSRMGRSMRRWLDAGLDGWRVGAATMAGRYGDVDLNAEIARWSREQVDDALLVAEYWHDYGRDLDGRGWHGVMNYAGFLRPVWWWLRGDAVGETVFDIFAFAPAPLYSGDDAADVMQSFRAGIPWEVTLHSWLFVDTHDTPRFKNVTSSRDRQLVGIGLQMTTPGVPLVFAGDEIGLEGVSGYDIRRTMPWDRPERWDAKLLDAYKRLIALRRSSEALSRGGLRYIHADGDTIAYLRETKGERLLCLASRAAHDPISVPFRNLETLYGDDARDGVLPSHGPAFHVWRIDES